MSGQVAEPEGGRPGRRVLVTALVTAAGVYAVLLVQALIGTLTSSALAGVYGFSDAQRTAAASYLVDLVTSSLTTALPFAIGVFLALWQLVPISSRLRFAMVVLRSLVSAAIGGLCVVAVAVVVGVVAGLASRTLLYGGGLADAGDRVWTNVLSGVTSAVQAFVQDVPLVVLAGLILWGWLQRHPGPAADAAEARGTAREL